MTTRAGNTQGRGRNDSRGDGSGHSGRGAGARHEFLRGLRLKHPLILLLAAALTVPCLLGLQWLFTSGTFAHVPEEHVLRRAGDDYMHISWWVGRLKIEQPETPLVCVFGGSSARESIVSGPSLAARVTADGGPALLGLDFGSFNQNMAATLAVIDNLPATGGCMVIGVNPSRFSVSPKVNGRQSEGRKIIVQSDSLEQVIDDLGGPQRTTFGILPGIASYLGSYLQQQRGSLLRLRLPTTPYRLHRYTVAGRRSKARKQATVERWLTVRAPDFRRHFQYNLELLDAAVSLAVRRGSTVILMEQPWNRDIIGDRYAWAQDMYRAGCREIAAAYPGVRYVDLNPRLDLNDDDFYDLFHLVGDAPRQWEEALAAEVAAVLEAASAAAGPPSDPAACPSAAPALARTETAD
jgi:hypothetical protein